MTKSKVYEALNNGKKVSLPEWVGYWFMQDGKIKVYTKEGNILDTPYIELLDARSDWIIVDGKKDFSGILYALKAGKSVARTEWNDKNMYLVMVNPKNYSFAKQGNESAFIGMKTAQDTFEAGWRPTTMDMLAEDWIILD